ncbi:MAG TPA: FKBP-type peptidyl-prolyl cis-trans isomerase [Candidatus Hydrogenedentes bacterium]|nr:FKBP-type peptidyl-prolyl cis-trans isomerase [Candidatus Hydrogenedentota bacterium]HQL94514.1 FKBP-type peptidyl-prolyl cis-trans isomerase [Candidatus Hydrogenedentota bacterium]
MTRARTGDRVAVTYRVTRMDGEVVDASPEGAPLELALGGGKYLPGFEAAVAGMAPGESKDIVIPPEEAFGVFDAELVLELSADQFPEGSAPETGSCFVMETEDGRRSLLTVVGVDGDQVVVDANHPLVGEALRLEVTLEAVLGPDTPEAPVTGGT